jgi:hypothetical protein
MNNFLFTAELDVYRKKKTKTILSVINLEDVINFRNFNYGFINMIHYLFMIYLREYTFNILTKTTLSLMDILPYDTIMIICGYLDDTECYKDEV